MAVTNSRIHALILAALVLAVGAIAIKPRVPQSDELVYLSHAYALARHGVFGAIVGGRVDEAPEPTARITPLVPAVHALAMRLSPRLLQQTRCLLSAPPQASACVYTSVISNIFQLLLWSVCLSWVAFQLAVISGNWPFAYMTTAAILSSGAMFEYANQYNSEGLYLPIFMVCLVALGRALTTSTLRYWLIAGITLGFCALARPVFFYLFCLLLPCSFVTIMLSSRSRRTVLLQGVAVFALVFSMVLAPWLVRNATIYGKPVMTVSYGAHTLSYRIAYNRMTPDEYLSAWVYWIPDFGDSLARRLFRPAQYQRLDLSDERGFNRQVAGEIQQEILRRSGASVSTYSAGQKKVEPGWVLREYVLDDIANHLKVTLLLYWRGVTLNSYFGLVGLAVVVWAIGGRLRAPLRQVFLIILGVVTLNCLFHAFISLNIARYSAPMILPMAMAYAALGERLLKRAMDW